jgi:hypothetical protein
MRWIEKIALVCILSTVAFGGWFVSSLVDDYQAHAQLVGGGSNRDLGPVVTLNGVLAAGSPVFSADQFNSNAHALKCVVNITAITGTLTVTVYGKDGASGGYYTVLASAALNSTGQTVLTVGPGMTAASNTVVNDYLPPLWRVGAAIVTGPATATVGCAVIE